MERDEIKKLGRQDWLILGLKVISESGIEAVRIESLAKMLNVTKGSFYWHFKNREELLDVILNEWEERNTDDIIKLVEAEERDANAKLLNLFQLAAQVDGRLEQAMRNWAISDARAAAAIEQIDQRRLDYLLSLFLQLDFSIDHAIARARLAYYSWVGEFAVGFRFSQAERLAEARLKHTILVRRG